MFNLSNMTIVLTIHLINAAIFKFVHSLRTFPRFLQYEKIFNPPKNKCPMQISKLCSSSSSSALHYKSIAIEKIAKKIEERSCERIMSRSNVICSNDHPEDYARSPGDYFVRLLLLTKFHLLYQQTRPPPNRCGSR